MGLTKATFFYFSLGGAFLNVSKKIPKLESIQDLNFSFKIHFKVNSKGTFYSEDVDEMVKMPFM